MPSPAHGDELLAGGREEVQDVERRELDVTADVLGRRVGGPGLRELRLGCRSAHRRPGSCGRIRHALKPKVKTTGAGKVTAAPTRGKWLGGVPRERQSGVRGRRVVRARTVVEDDPVRVVVGDAVGLRGGRLRVDDLGRRHQRHGAVGGEADLAEHRGADWCRRCRTARRRRRRSRSTARSAGTPRPRRPRGRRRARRRSGRRCRAGRSRCRGSGSWGSPCRARRRCAATPASFVVIWVWPENSLAVPVTSTESPMAG